MTFSADQAEKVFHKMWETLWKHFGENLERMKIPLNGKGNFGFPLPVENEGENFMGTFGGC
jgi:hypothetical protein